MFERFYASFTQQPILLWVAALAGLVVVVLRTRVPRSVRVFCLAFGLLPFFDAWLTADDVAGFGALGPLASAVVPTFFVIVGDTRALLVFECATDDGEIPLSRAGVLRAALWSLVVPVASALLRAALPDVPWRMRVVFLFYEVAFAALVTARFRLGAGKERAPGWTRPVVRYVLVYYVLWALADVMILAGLDAGYLVRVVPNVLYYGGLLAMVSLAAPAPKRSLASSPSR
jgi:hypothetical protein